ncbi:MAG: tyrosine-type recombinase/integrase, partial [Spirochaetota bacterium]
MHKSARNLPVFLSQKEVESFNRFIRRPRHRVGFALMSYGGLRVSEVCGLKVSDINVARGFMKVHGKGNKDRIVPINNKLQSIIENYLHDNSSDLNE